MNKILPFCAFSAHVELGGRCGLDGGSFLARRPEPGLTRPKSKCGRVEGKVHHKIKDDEFWYRGDEVPWL
jgi:hypothetical protein